MRSLVLMFLCSALVLTACGDDVQFAEPPKRDAAPTRMPHAHPHPGGGHPESQGGSGGATEGDPFNPAEVSGGNTGETGDPTELLYSGEVVVTEGLELPNPSWIWISAGHPPSGRPPVLTKLYENPTFPFKFELRRRDTAFPGAAVPKAADLVLYASVGKNRFVEGIVLKAPPTGVHSMGTKDIKIQVAKP